MEKRINRAKVLLENWKALERQLDEFGGAVGASQLELLQQGHDLLSRGLNRMSASPLAHEKAHEQLLKSALMRMEEKLYPNPLVRFMVRLKARLIDRPAQMKEFERMKLENLASLKKFMVERGFGVVAGELENVLDYERPMVAVSMSSQLDGERYLDLSLSLSKAENGGYAPDCIHARFYGPGGLEVYQPFSFSDPFDAEMVVNLIQGRAVCIGEDDGSPGNLHHWLQLSGDADGRMRYFKEDYVFRVEGLLQEVSVLFGRPSLHDERIVGELKKGNQVSVIVGAPFNQKLLLEANPGDKSLLVRDEWGAVVEMRELMEKKKAYALKEKEISKAVQLGVGRSKRKGQQKGLGI